MKKLFTLLILSTTTHLVFASPLFYNKSENPVEITYKFCNFSFPTGQYVCENSLKTTIKGKNYSHITVPKDADYISIISTVEHDANGSISARGDYEMNCGASFHTSFLTPDGTKQALNPVITFDDMFQSPIIICDARATSGDLT